MHFALVLALAAGSLQGIATSAHAPLPGCTVTLSSATGKQQTYTDVDGRYRFHSIDPGRYDLLFELEGLQPVQRSIYIEEGANEQPPAELPVDQTETITLSCGGPPCNDTPPETVWDWPTCTDYELDAALIEAMERGDRSALELLRSRYDRAWTYPQRHTIAEALLRRVPDDRVYWNELFEHARNAVRFFSDDDHSDEYRRWCEERGYDPHEHDGMSLMALWMAAEDPRSRDLLLEALKRDMPTLADAAIWGLAMQRDLTALPAIEQALERCREIDEDDCSARASGLAVYRHEQADQLAFRYLDETQRNEYLQARNAPPEE